MNTKKTSVRSKADTITLVILIAVALVGIMVIAGWHLHIRFLVQVIPGVISMQYNTALCFLMLGASAGIHLAQRERIIPPAIGGAFVALMGILVVFEYMTGISLGIDTLFFYPWERTLSADPGRMALTAAISFTCVGVAIVLKALRPRALAAFAIAHALPLSFGVTSLLGYALGITYVLPFRLGSQMAVHTALSFTFYGGAMLAYAWRHAPQTDEGLPRWTPGIATIIAPVIFIGLISATQSHSLLARGGQVFLALAGAGLLGYLIRKLPQLKIAYKGLVLTSIPLVFVLAFVILVSLVKRENARAQERSLHSKEVMAQAEFLLKILLDAETGMRGYVITDNPNFTEPYDRATREMPEAIRKLQELVNDNPAQAARSNKLKAKASEKMDHMTRVVGLMRAGAKQPAAEMVKSGVGKQTMDEFRQETDEFLREENQLDATRREAIEKSWQRFDWLLTAGASADILLAFAALLLFSRGISSRLNVLTENVHGLADGKGIAEPLKGTDEIAQLDRVFHQMAEALDEAARKERAIVENALDVIYAVDVEGKFARVSPASFKVWGYHPHELIGRRYIELIVPEDIAKSNEAAHEIMAGKEATNFENRYIRKDGSEVSIMWSASWSESDKLMFCVAHDVSERKQAEEKIKQLNENLEKRSTQLEYANKELEAFSYSVSHDLRAPLRAIDGFSRILLEDYAEHLDAEGKRVLDVVRANSKQMGQLIDDLLAFSRLSRTGIEKSEIDMTKLARSVTDELRHPDPDRAVDVQIDSLPTARGDMALLRQVFINLISNALKYTRHKPEAKVEISSFAEGDMNVYCVKDNGAGFDMQYANKLFGVFQRLHRADEFEGTGVGLAIIQRIVHRHGGKVWAEAKVGEGATFYFTISDDGENTNGNKP